MRNDLIRYDLLVQDALRGVVRKVLTDAAKHGLPGDHHFYITFETGARGVRLSNRVREMYPDKLTIVIQHQFWELSVNESGFEVGLSFSRVPEKLFVPFDAIVEFSDPSVEFGLKFVVQEFAVEPGANDAKPVSTPTKLPARGSEKTPRGAASEPAEAPPSAKSAAKAALSKEPEKSAGEPTKVVSIDAFRKK